MRHNTFGTIENRFERIAATLSALCPVAQRVGSAKQWSIQPNIEPGAEMSHLVAANVNLAGASLNLSGRPTTGYNDLFDLNKL